MNLHPWEFWEYTFEDYLLKRNGFYDYRRIDLKNNLQHFRYVAYWCVYPHLKKTAQNKPWTDIIPDIYDKSTKPEDTKEWFEERRKDAKKWKDKLAKSNLKVVGK